MIIGTPYHFSIIVKVLDEWSKERAPFYNGILLFCIGGALFPKEIDIAEAFIENVELQKMALALDHILI